MPGAVEAQAVPSSSQAQAGDVLNLDVTIDPQQYGITAGEIELSVDAAVFLALSIDAGGLLGASVITGTNQVDEANGTLRIAIARIGVISSSDIPTAPGVLATVALKVRDTAPVGRTDVEIPFVGLADDDYKNVSGISVSGTSILITQ